MPCNLGNLGYPYFPVCLNDLFYKTHFSFAFATLLRFLSPCLFAWVSFHTFGCAILEYTILCSMHCYCLMNYLYLFRNRYIQGRTRYSNITRYLNSVKIYKQIQILMLLYNDIHQGALSAAGTTLCTYVFVLSFYSVINLSQYLLLPQIIFFAGLAFDTMLIVVLVDGIFKAGVYKVSNQVLDSVTKFAATSWISNKKLRRKHIQSWRVPKIYMGTNNYYDGKTALVILDFNLSQVVNLLLM